MHEDLNKKDAKARRDKEKRALKKQKNAKDL